MNILYISVLDGRPWAGPTYSVPKQIEAQSKVDNVLWFNLVKGSESKWQDAIKSWRSENYYFDLDDFSEGKIESLPTPFSSPDLVVMEQCYPFAKSGHFAIMKELKKRKLKYIVTPRGELTESAQSCKRIKKELCNAVIMKRFIRNAAAIQFLTEEEKTTTNSAWNKNSLIVPNGTDLPKDTKESFMMDGHIHIISIGRIAVYHKGLDLLIDACKKNKELLISSNCLIDIYGPDRENKIISLTKEVEQCGLQKVVKFHDGVYGDEKNEVMRGADVFIMTSRFEGHPTALIDAMAFGLPCIVTTGTNMRNVIEEGSAGWTADTTVDSISMALEKMIQEKNFLAEKSHRSREVAEQYSWKKLAEQSHAKYLSL